VRAGSRISRGPGRAAGASQGEQHLKRHVQGARELPDEAEVANLEVGVILFQNGDRPVHEIQAIGEFRGREAFGLACAADYFVSARARIRGFRRGLTAAECTLDSQQLEQLEMQGSRDRAQPAERRMLERLLVVRLEVPVER
jgi:hypothetical protein